MKTQISNIVIWAEDLIINESLKNLNLIIEKGELIGITVLDMDDKRDIIRMLGCFNKPKKGKYIFDYEDIQSVQNDRLEAIRTEKIGYIFETPKLFDDLNVVQNVTFWLKYICSKDSSNEMEKIILKDLGIEEKSQFCIEQLSNLEKVIVSLARATINKPELLLVDDIFSWLKPEEADEIINLLLKFTAKGTTVIIFTNSQKVLSSVNRIIRFYEVCV